MSDTDTAVKNLKALDPSRPIRELDIVRPVDSQPAHRGSDLPALLSLLDVPTDDLQWLRLDRPGAAGRTPGCIVP